MLSDPCRIGQIIIQKATGRGFILCHRDDKQLRGLQEFNSPDDAIEIAKVRRRRKLSPAENRAQSAARMAIGSCRSCRLAARFGLFLSWPSGRVRRLEEKQIRTTPLRETLNRQSGMYRVAAKISDDQIDDLVGDFCQSRRRMFADDSVETQ